MTLYLGAGVHYIAMTAARGTPPVCARELDLPNGRELRPQKRIPPGALIDVNAMTPEIA